MRPQVTLKEISPAKLELRIVSLLAVSLFILIYSSNSVRGATIFVPTGGDLQGAIDSANCGDEIVLQAGASYTVPGAYTPFSLRYKGPCTGTDADYITIRSSNLAGLPPAGTRVTPANGPALPKIVTNVSSAALEGEANAHHYKLIGIEFTNTGSVITGDLVEIGRIANGGYLPFPQHPHHITFDRCWVHEATNDTMTADGAETTAERGFLINADDITLVDSRIAGFRGFYKGTTSIVASNAILIPYAAQRVSIKNCYLEAWFVPLFLGGTGTAESPNVATVAASPAATLSRATLSQVANLAIGDLIAFKVTGGTNASGPLVYEVARVTGINGNVVDYLPQKSSLEATLQGGNPLEKVPDSPGDARWRGYNPTDILIERNQFVLNFNSTEYVWTHTGGSPTTQYPFTSLGNGPKGHIEIKVGKRLTINANTFEGWYNTFVISTRNQTNSLDAGGAPWATVEDLTITNNWWKKSPNWNRQYSDGLGGPQLEDNEYTSTRGKNVIIANNLWESGAEAFLKFGSADNTTVRHNTFPGSSMPRAGAMLFATGSPSYGFIFQDNILNNNEYGMSCQVSGASCWPGKVQDHNVIIDNRSDGVKGSDGSLQPVYPTDYIAASQSAVGWTDLANGNYRLAASSPYKGSASDGKDPGVDIDELLAALSGSTPSATPTPTPAASPTPRTPASVERARDYANLLISYSDSNGSSGIFTLASASDLISLTREIEQAYSDFTVERNLFGAVADSVERQILGALYFSRTAAALAGRVGISSSVKDHLRRIVAHLSMADDLMLYGSITPPTAAQAAAVNARANIIIGAASCGYTPTSSALLAPASLGSVFGNSGQSPLSTQSVFAVLSSNNELPYELGGVSVTIGGQTVPVIYVSPSRVTFFVPADLTLGAAEVIVASQDGYVSSGTTTIAQNVFRIMTSAEDETGPAVVMNAIRQTGNDLDVITPENFGSDKRTRVTIFATGISGSAANPDTSNDLMINGVVQPNFAESVAVEARMTDGHIMSLPVEFAGAQGTLPGLDQVNVVLLSELQGAGTVELTLIINGQRSNAPTIIIR